MQFDLVSIVAAIVILIAVVIIIMKKESKTSGIAIIAVGVVFLIDSCFLRYKPVVQLVILSILFIMIGIFWIVKSYKK
jgi:uncharacterized protein involved in response to NO